MTQQLSLHVCTCEWCGIITVHHVHLLYIHLTNYHEACSESSVPLDKKKCCLKLNNLPLEACRPVIFTTDEAFLGTNKGFEIIHNYNEKNRNVHVC